MLRRGGPVALASDVGLELAVLRAARLRRQYAVLALGTATDGGPVPTATAVMAAGAAGGGTAVPTPTPASGQ